MEHLKQIIEDSELDFNEVAKQLFPSNKYPRLALNRVLQGHSNLDSQQLSKLSKLTGLEIENIISPGNTWEIRSSKKGIIKFQNDVYSAELNLNTNITKVFHKESLIHEEILHTNAIVLSEYFEKLNSIINN